MPRTPTPCPSAHPPSPHRSPQQPRSPAKPKPHSVQPHPLHDSQSVAHPFRHPQVLPSDRPIHDLRYPPRGPPPPQSRPPRPCARSAVPIGVPHVQGNAARRTVRGPNRDPPRPGQPRHELAPASLARRPVATTSSMPSVTPPWHDLLPLLHRSRAPRAGKPPWEHVPGVQGGRPWARCTSLLLLSLCASAPFMLRGLGAGCSRSVGCLVLPAMSPCVKVRGHAPNARSRRQAEPKSAL